MRLDLRMKGCLAALFVVALTGLAACGGSDDGSADSGDKAASGGDVAALEAAAQKAVTEAEGPQSARPPKSGPKAVTGKRVVILSCAQAAEGCSRPAAAAMEATKDLGWDTLLIDGAADPAKIQAGIDRAVSLGVDGMIAFSVDSANVTASLEKAKAAGIALVAGTSGNDPDLYDAVVPEPEIAVDAGYIVGQKSYLMTKGDPKLVMNQENSFAAVRDRVKGTEQFIDDCKAAGGTCEILSNENVQLADLTTTMPQQAANQVQNNPDMNVFWSSFDAGVPFQIQGLESAGLTDKGFGISFDGNSPNVDIIREGGYSKATMALPHSWIGYAVVDQMNRIFAGEEPVDQGVRNKLLTIDNIPPKGPWEGDQDVAPLYRKIWGVN